MDCAELASAGQKSKTSVAADDEFDVCVGLHAHHSGKVLVKCATPYVLVLGGTDVNGAYATNDETLQLMTDAIFKAGAVVASSESLHVRALELWPSIADNLHLIPAGTDAQRLVDCSLDGGDGVGIFSLRKALGLDTDTHIFALVAGLRPVKVGSSSTLERC